MLNDYDIETYIQSRHGTNSLLNNCDIRLNMVQDVDYIEIRITDKYKYRADKLANHYIGDKRYYFFIFWINNIYDFNDLNSGNVIKIPTISFIKNLRNRIQIERGF